MKLKVLLFLILSVTAVFTAWQYWQYRQGPGQSCGGDWSYRTTCSLGSYCRSIGQGPLAGGTCQSYLSPIFDLSILSKLWQKPEGGKPTPQEVPKVEGQFCGGIVNISCPAGYRCQLEDNHPDAGGKCVSTSQPKFTCPKREWVNCLPGPGPAKAECRQDFLDWAKTKCPGFRGAAW